MESRFEGYTNGQIHDRVSWHWPWSQPQALGGIHHVQGDDDHRECSYVVGGARAASSGIWTALSRTRTARRSIRGGPRPTRAPKRSSLNNGRTGGGGGQVPDRAEERHEQALHGDRRAAAGGEASGRQREKILASNRCLQSIGAKRSRGERSPVMRTAPSSPVARHDVPYSRASLVKGTFAMPGASSRMGVAWLIHGLKRSAEYPAVYPTRRSFEICSLSREFAVAAGGGHAQPSPGHVSCRHMVDGGLCRGAAAGFKRGVTNSFEVCVASVSECSGSALSQF